MNAKVIVYGLSNTGKTTLVEHLKNAYVISYDGKDFPLLMPHLAVKPFDTLDEFFSQVNAGLEAYEAKYGEKPETIVLDTLSNLLGTCEANCKKMYSNFKVWDNLNAEMSLVSEFIQWLTETANVVVLSHCIQDEENGTMIEPLSGKAFKKIGGYLGKFDYSCYLTFNKRKREIYLRNHELARTLLKEYPDQMLVDNFSLQEYLDKIKTKTIEAKAWSLVD